MKGNCQRMFAPYLFIFHDLFVVRVDVEISEPML